MGCPSRRHALAALAAVVVSAGAARAQTPAVASGPLSLGTSISGDSLEDLPLGATIFSLLDSVVPQVVSDRVDAGSTMPGQAARVGAYGSSWTQTTFRFGDADVTDPRGSGAPLILPGLLAWQRVDVTTGSMTLDENAPGLMVTLVPRRPTAVWTRSFELLGGRPGILSRTIPLDPPAITRLNTWTNGNLFLSGPLLPGRLGIVFIADWTNATHYERSDPTQLHDKLVTVFTHLVYTPSARDEARLAVWGQAARSPFEHRIGIGQPDAALHDSSAHVQLAWDRRADSGWTWTAAGAFSTRGQTADINPVSGIVVERLRDGPVPALLSPLGSDSTWSIGATVKPTATDLLHRAQAGVTLFGATTSARAPFGGRIGELVDGVPARIWDYSVQTADSRWHELALSAYAGDSIQVHPRLTIDGGARIELVNGSADGSSAGGSGIAWRNWYPRAGLRLELTNVGHIAALARFSRYGYRLSIGDLAYGDASAPTANVYRWNATAANPQLSQLGPLIARVGPGTGGDPTFSAIDPRLNRPYMDEVTLGFESRPDQRTRVRVLGVVRRERQLIGVIDTGAPASAYSVSTIVDPGTDKYGGQVLPVYNLTPGAFGKNRYLLTNPADDQATFTGVEITSQTTTDHFFAMAGATAGRSEGLSANRGFHPGENDDGIIGDVFTDPNAATNARGRVFTERGYTIKTAGGAHLPGDIRLGLAARYQDGEHFARLVIVPGLNQGTEAIRAFSNGRTRFTYTLTIDARLQKTFTAGAHHVTAIIDAYNLLNTATEIEEFPVTGPTSRLTAAVQPPRSLHIGLKLPF